MSTIIRTTTESLAEHSITAEMRRRLFDGTKTPVRVFRAPGRVNLIGEHTDYNDGFVFPVAIQFYVWIAVSRRDDSKLILSSDDFSDTVEIDLDENAARPRRHWSDYVEGVAVSLQASGLNLRGANLLVHGNVPIGAGLSSSAAIGVATGLALLENSGASIPRIELAKICQRSENEFVGAKVGIMDPYISCCGQEGKALLLDCRSLDSRAVPLPEDVSLVICNTMVKHALSGGDYNTRRSECEQGVRILKQHIPGIRALRDVSSEDLERNAPYLPEVVYRRCRHVVSENARVLNSGKALEQGDVEAFGRCMAESHRSLRDDYEVSCLELDAMVEIANEQNGVYGARMTGGGFGGCTVNVVKNGNVPAFQESIAREYERITGIRPQVYVARAAEGAGEVIEPES